MLRPRLSGSCTDISYGAFGPTSADVSGVACGPLAESSSDPTSNVPVRVARSMSRVTWGTLPTAASIAGLPADSRNTLPAPRTSLGSTVLKPLAGIVPPEVPLTMLPWNFRLDPVPRTAVPPLPTKMLSTTATSDGGNFLSLPYRTTLLWVVTSVLNATRQ